MARSRRRSTARPINSGKAERKITFGHHYCSCQARTTRLARLVHVGASRWENTPLCVCHTATLQWTNDLYRQAPVDNRIWHRDAGFAPARLWRSLATSDEPLRAVTGLCVIEGC